MEVYRKQRLLLLSLVSALVCSVPPGASAVYSGLIKVIPEDEYVPVGSNYTVYCSINRSQSSDSSANLVWSKGYPPFTDWRPNPGPTPANETRIVNDTTVSITFFNMATTDTDYYFCYLKGTSRYQDTDHCDIHVIEFPKPLENLTCSAYTMEGLFYCFWEDQQTNYHETYHATYVNVFQSNTDGPKVMFDCESSPTPGVPKGYLKKCGTIDEYFIDVNVEITNPVGSVNSSIRYEVLSTVTPLPLENLVVNNEAATSVSITGGPPPFFGPIGYLNKYEVSYAPVDGAEWQTKEIDGNDLDIDLHGLHPNTFYNVRGRSEVQDNWSEWSPNTTFKTSESMPTIPVSSLEYHPVGISDEYHRNVKATWEGLSKYQMGADTFTYFVELLIDNGTGLVVTQNETTIDNEETFHAISKFYMYKIRVTPTNHLGTAPSSVVTVNDLSGVPGKPYNLRWVPFSTTAGTLFWSDPLEPNSIISEFRLEWQKVHDHQDDTQPHSGVLVKKPGVSDFQYSVRNLATYDLYRFSVCSVGRGSTECDVQSESEITDRTLPGAPENPPVGFHAEPAEDEIALQLTWRAPSGDHNGVIVGYLVSYCEEEEDSGGDCLLSAGSVNTLNCSAFTSDGSLGCTLRDLRPFTRYRLTVAAKAGYLGPTSSPITAKTAESMPDPPYNLVVRSESSMVIRVQWHPPVNMNGVFSHYQIHCQGCQSEKQHSTVETSALLDVYGDTKVSVSVRTCLKNHGLVSSFAGPVTIHTPIARPSAPRGLEIPDIHGNKAVLNWETPKYPNGPIVMYRVQYRKSSEGDWEDTRTVNNKSLDVQVNCKMGMDNMYDFSVEAGVKNGSTIVYGEPSIIHDRKLCSAQTTWTTFMMVCLASMAILVVVACLIVFIRYHQRVKKNLPDPYFIDSVKSSIYGHNTWTYNESQFFILERESFDTLRCVDDSTQLLGLDRMHSTEGSTSSSDQGIHDMDGRLAATGSCSRLVPDGKEEEKGNWKRPLRVLCEDFDKDPDFTREDDAVFPEDTDNYGPSDSVTVSLSYSSSPLQHSTPPNSPASMAASNHSSERIDSGTASCCGEPTKYAKLTDSQLSPTSTMDDSSRPLSSASEDSMNYTRIGENSAISPCPDASGHFGSSAAKGGVSPDSQKQMTTNKGSPRRAAASSSSAASPVSKEKSRHPSTDSSSDELSGYCKQDLTAGLVNPVTSSGVSSLGEDYSRIAEGDAQASGPAESLSSYPAEDPYITDQQMRANEGRLQSSENPTPLQDLSPTVETSPYTSPYVTSEHAV